MLAALYRVKCNNGSVLFLATTCREEALEFCVRHELPTLKIEYLGRLANLVLHNDEYDDDYGAIREMSMEEVEDGAQPLPEPSIAN